MNEHLPDMHKNMNTLYKLNPIITSGFLLKDSKMLPFDSAILVLEYMYIFPIVVRENRTSFPSSLDRQMMKNVPWEESDPIGMPCSLI